MEFGLSTLLFPDGSPESGIELASELDINYVEMILDMPHFPFNPKQERLDEINNLIDSSELSVRAHGRFWDLNPVSLYSEMRELSLNQTIKSVDACDKIGGDVVTIHPGRSWFRGNEELFQKCEKWFKEYLEETSSYAQEKGIKLAVETGSHNADYPGNPIELLESVQDMEEVGITLDVGHLFLSAQDRDVKGEEWISNKIEMLSDELINIHLHDNHGISDDHLPPGEGEIDFHPIMKSLEENYEGPLILEIWDLSNPLEAVKESISHLQEISN